MVKRLESCVIDMEQSITPVLVVSHVSVIQILLAYFRGTSVTECTKITVPMHTVIKLRPVMGGSWLEEHEEICDVDKNGTVRVNKHPEKRIISDKTKPIWDDPPIWDDHVRC